MADDASPLEPMDEDWERGLVVIAHPDDIEYGGSAAIARWTAAGKHVAYVLATRGEAGIDSLPPAECAPIREAEQIASAAAVGVDVVEFLDHRDGVIVEGVELRRDIAGAIRRHRPELIVTLNHHDHWGFGARNTADHRAVGRATLDAVADAGNRWIFPELIGDGGHEPWSGVRWVAVAGSPQPTHAVDVSDKVEAAVQSLLCHRAYIEALTDEEPEDYVRSFLTGTMAGAGERFGGRPAVAFEVIPC
ncbi:MAG: PIG-L deacetylase family protein [Actinomycetota bacterium]|nr:PIG-L deacetylase family protein [Actinomycetota bacterium]